MSEPAESLDAPLHRLWTKAVGTPTYQKSEWLLLERVFLNRVSKVLGLNLPNDPRALFGLLLEKARVLPDYEDSEWECLGKLLGYR